MQLDNLEEPKYYFVTDCYGKNVDEVEIYSCYIRKSIIELDIGEISLLDFCSVLKTEYRADIPTAVVDAALKRLSNRDSFIFYKNDTVTVDKIPDAVRQHYESFHKKFNSDSTLVYAAFKEYVATNAKVHLEEGHFVELMARVREP